MAVIALDLGGTKLAGALYSGGNGRLLAKAVWLLAGRRGSDAGRLVRDGAGHLLGLARARRVKVTAVGVSVPGISYPKSGTVWAPNIPGWDRYPLRREIQSALGKAKLRVVIESDRACCILGERWRGAARGCRNAIFLAVGTGIGAGILVDGRVLRGAWDSAGAIGWLALDRPFRPAYAACGCFEHHASGAGLAGIATEMQRDPRFRRSRLRRPGPLTARDVFAAARKGDPAAKAVLRQAVEFWGMAVANLVSLFNPERIVFGGGVFGPARRYLPQIRREAKKWAQPIALRQVKLRASKLGSAAGLHGAAWLALRPDDNV